MLLASLTGLFHPIIQVKFRWRASERGKIRPATKGMPAGLFSQQGKN
jgi:hypothetical protein